MTVKDQLKEKSIVKVRASKIRTAMSTEEMVRNYYYEMKTMKLILTNIILCRIKFF